VNHRKAATSSVRVSHRAARRALLARPEATHPGVGVVTTIAGGTHRPVHRALLANHCAIRPCLGVAKNATAGPVLAVSRAPPSVTPLPDASRPAEAYDNLTTMGSGLGWTDDAHVPF